MSTGPKLLAWERMVQDREGSQDGDMSAGKKIIRG